MIFDQIKDFNKLRKTQSEVKKQLEQIFATYEKQGIKVVVRGDRRLEKLEINGQEDKKLKDILNDAFKEADKKVEKQMRGQLKDLGLPQF